MLNPVCLLALMTMTATLSAQAPGPKSNIIKESEPMDPRLSIEAWPADQTFVEANTLPFNGSTPHYDEPVDINSQRVLGMPIKPGEKLSFRMKAENSKVLLRAYEPVPPPTMKWRLALQNANRIPWQIRTSRFSIKNESSDPQTFFLIICGAHGHSYRVDLIREAK